MEKGCLPIVIPYLADAAQGDELALAVTGWRSHFLDDYKIVIVGDWNPIIETGDDIDYIACHRIRPVKGQYLPHLDIVNKFIRFREKYPGCEGFIYACDDMYAVRDFTIYDVAAPKVSDRELREFDWKKEGDWLGDLGKTREFCATHNIPVMNWVCHLPVLYETDKLFELIDQYDGRRKSYVWENIYFNLFRSQQEPELVPPTGSKWKYEVKTSNPGIRSTDDANAIWITNANCGWSRRLEQILREHYGSAAANYL